MSKELDRSKLYKAILQVISAQNVHSSLFYEALDNLTEMVGHDLSLLQKAIIINDIKEDYNVYPTIGVTKEVKDALDGLIMQGYVEKRDTHVRSTFLGRSFRRTADFELIMKEYEESLKQ